VVNCQLLIKKKGGGIVNYKIMDTLEKKIIVILGTTASGKTGLAVKLAYKFNGEIVSADSRQVYRGLDIGSGKDLDNFQWSRPEHSGGIMVVSRAFWRGNG